MAMIHSKDCTLTGVRSSNHPAPAELIAVESVKIANSTEKTRPRTFPGTMSSKTWVESTQLTPEPKPRTSDPISTSMKLAVGATKARPAAVTKKDNMSAVLRRSTRS